MTVEPRALLNPNQPAPRMRMFSATSRRLIAQVPVGRLGRPEDIAGLVAFLVSSWGDFICGQEIMADGGRTIFGKQAPGPEFTET